MDYRKLTAEHWNNLDSTGSFVSGYISTLLTAKENNTSDIHIFKDESDHMHFSIKTSGLKRKSINDPGVNGLQIKLTKFRLENKEVNEFIDIKCTISSYVNEFTEVVKEISHAILEEKEKPEKAIKRITNNWISFWANQCKNILSEERQIGLICELLFLKKLCTINSDKALNFWVGPLGEKHDFNFTDWSFEVKGTRKKDCIHTINGIDQLQSNNKKKLAFLSYMVSLKADSTDHSINLPTLIKQIKLDHFSKKPNLIVRLNELLAGAGYSPIHNKEYSYFNLEVNSNTFYEVNENFPKLTSNMLTGMIHKRVFKIRYDISLEGLTGTDIDLIPIGDYFY